MVFSTKKKSAIINSQDYKIIDGPPIKSIKGIFLYENINILDMDIGQLVQNQNMEYNFSSGKIYLSTRRGSTLQKDISNAVKGASQFIATDGTANFVWIDTEGKLKYLTTAGAITEIETGLDSSNNTEFFMYGHPLVPTLYGVNATDGFFKVDSSFSYTNILSTQGFDSFAYSNISRRLVFVKGHKAFFSNAQDPTAADNSNLETLDIAANGQWILVSPDEGTGIKKVADNGEITFFFKDTGIWALLNAEEEIANWAVPKCSADQGTKSPKTVAFGRYGQNEGFIYLATDKTLRYFNARVQRNSGALPTLIGGDSLVISSTFQKLLDDIPDDKLSLCSAVYFGRYYIINVVGKNDSDLSRTIIIDTDKLMARNESDDIAQPFWFEAVNMDISNYVVEAKTKLYGFYTDGYINQLLVKDKHYDETPPRINTYDDDEMIDSAGAVTTVVGDAVLTRVAIRWNAYFGWFKYSNRELMLYDAYINWEVDGKWPINFVLNSYEMGNQIPEFTDGLVIELNPQKVSGSYFDRDFFSEAFFSDGSGQLSQNLGAEGRGNYFLFGMYGNNIDEWASFYGIEPRFKVVKNSPQGRNV